MGVSIWEGNKAERVASALEMIAAAHSKDIDLTNFRQIQGIVKAGKAQDFFNLGDQIDVIWKPDNESENTYHIPFDVVSFLPVTDGKGNVHQHAMWLQSHYALMGIQFSENNAFYVPAEAMPAGTYFFTLGSTWGTHCVIGKIYEFTTTQEVPAGGQLVLGTATSNTSALPDNAPSNWRVRTFANGAQADPTEILELTEVESSTGTDLGVLSSSTKYAASGINNMQRAAYGYNRYAHSAIRQWLNSDAEKGGWWKQKNPFDHRPDQLATAQGFMAGLPQDFLQIVQPILVTTALNTTSDSELGASETTVDRFFLPSLEQEYIVPQAKGVEGAYWEYWKERLELESPQAQGGGGANPAHIRYAYENHNSAQYVRLRSATRAGANLAWNVNPGGTASTNTATTANRPAPACVIY